MCADDEILTAPKLHWRSWDGEFVAFHELSGDTHRLDAATTALLEDLADSPATEAEVAARVAATWPEEHTATEESPAAQLIRRLRRLSLIVPCRR